MAVAPRSRQHGWHDTSSTSRSSDLDIQYLLGYKQVVADALSRLRSASLERAKALALLAAAAAPVTHAAGVLPDLIADEDDALHAPVQMPAPATPVCDVLPDPAADVTPSCRARLPTTP